MYIDRQKIKSELMQVRFPRKLKKKLKKIPATGFCYGQAIADKGKMQGGKQIYKKHFCPFHSKSQLHCSLINSAPDDDYRDACLSDATAICKDELVYVGVFMKRLKFKNKKFLLQKT